MLFNSLTSWLWRLGCPCPISDQSMFMSVCPQKIPCLPSPMRNIKEKRKQSSGTGEQLVRIKTACPWTQLGGKSFPGTFPEQLCYCLPHDTNIKMPMADGFVRQGPGRPGTHYCRPGWPSTHRGIKGMCYHIQLNSCLLNRCSTSAVKVLSSLSPLWMPLVKLCDLRMALVWVRVGVLGHSPVSFVG